MEHTLAASSPEYGTSVPGTTLVALAMRGDTVFTLDGMMEYPQPKSMPDFRWSYTNVDSRGVFVRVILRDTSAANAVSQVQQHFPSFLPDAVRAGEFPGDPELIWQGTFEAPPKKSWLRRLFSRNARAI